MKYKKAIVLTIVALILITSAGCSKQEKAKEEPYLKYIITTYSGGEITDTFEVYSNMGWRFTKSSITVWDSPNEKTLLLYSTLEYKVEEITE